MATKTLQPDSVREKDDAEFRRLNDDFLPAATEAIKRMVRANKWSDAAALYDAALAALERVSIDLPPDDLSAPDYTMRQLIFDAVVDAKSDAMETLIETPAPDGAALIRKLEIVSSEAFDATPERLACLLADARRLFA